MTDTQVVDPGTTEEQAEAVAAMEPADKPAKEPKNVLKPCLCSTYEVGHFDETEGTADETIYTTDCKAQTKRQFAQGHDARLVSFLVDGFFDGYDIRQVVSGVARTFDSPQSAALVASEALGVKAEKATANRGERIKAKEAKTAERLAKQEQRKQEAADKLAAKQADKDAKAATKASAPKDVPVNVVSDPAPEGQVKIKVGRWEYNATIDGEGTASFTDGKGEPQTVERDGYRILS